jgi:AraC family transcriptional regulator
MKNTCHGQQEHSLRDALESLPTGAPLTPNAASFDLRWRGLQAVRFRDCISNEFSAPPIAQHALILITRPPEKMNLRYEGVNRDIPPGAGAVAVMPAGCASLWHWRGGKDSLHIYLEPSVIAQVATTLFELDSARVEIPPLDAVSVPGLRAAMLAVDAELTAGGSGGPLLIDSLANVLAIHLIRHFLGPRRLIGRSDGVLPRRKFQTVVEYIMQNLEGNLTLEQMASLVHISPYHFARQFKATTGLPPHQYVITRRVERAQQLLRRYGDLSLGEIALRVGFSDQSQFCFHFKRVVGVTPGQFRTSQESPKNSQDLPSIGTPDRVKWSSDGTQINMIASRSN